MSGNEHEILAEARRALGGLEFFRRMIHAHGTATSVVVDNQGAQAG